MTDTKEISTTTKLITAANVAILAASGALFALNSDTDKMDPVSIASEVRTDALLEAATKECQDEVALVGKDATCSWGCKTILGNAKTPTEGWCCNGAFMPSRVQTCLDDALAKMPKAVVAVEPVEVPR